MSEKRLQEAESEPKSGDGGNRTHETFPPKTGAQERSLDRLERRYGSVSVKGLEEDGRTLRVELADAEPGRSRDRLIWPSGLVEDVAA